MTGLEWLNPGRWLAVAGLCALAVGAGYVRGCNDGTNEQAAQWAAAREHDHAEAQRIERARQDRTDAAVRAAADAQGRARADAVAARAQSRGLRDDVAAIQQRAAQSLAACTQSAGALADVFQQCSDRYSELAEKADRHAADAVMLLEGWPRD